MKLKDKDNMSYYLRIYDNFHYYDVDDFVEVGNFDSEQEALLEAQKRVKDSVIHLWSTGTRLDELVNNWLDFGDNPTIYCTDPTIEVPFFSPGEYAVKVVEMLKESLYNNSHSVQTVFQKTIRFAAEKHARINQMVPGTNLPYVVHLSNVCMEIMLAAQNTEHFNIRLGIQAALLHDTLEDTETTEGELEGIFGIAVPVCVKALTKDARLSKEQQMQNSIYRIKNMPYEIWAVKMADRITNLQPPPSHWTNDKKKQYLEEAKVILKELKEGNDYLANRLGEKIEEYKTYLNADSV